MISKPVIPVKNGLFNAGLYFLVAPTKGGKTLLAYSLAHYNDFDLLYCNEPRANTDGFLDFLSNDGLINRASLIAGLTKYNGKKLIIDSIGDLFVTDKKTPGIGKGLSIDQIYYFKSVQKKALSIGCTLIGTVNSSLVPSISVFEGVSEGYIEITNINELIITDRDGRKNKPMVIPNVYSQAACDDLGYGTFHPPQFSGTDSSRSQVSSLINNVI